ALGVAVGVGGDEPRDRLRGGAGDATARLARGEPERALGVVLAVHARAVRRAARTPLAVGEHPGRVDAGGATGRVDDVGAPEQQVRAAAGAGLDVGAEHQQAGDLAVRAPDEGDDAALVVDRGAVGRGLLLVL